MKRWLIFLAAMWLAACASSRPSGSQSPAPGFTPGQFVKTDIDRIAEAHQRELYASLKLVAEKLYKRNPREWKKGGWARAEEPIERMFGRQHNWHFTELDGKFGTDSIQMALKPDYSGDRVFAFIAGLGGMTLAAFNDRYEFFLTADLDAQKLYNAARNIEISVWKLSQDRGVNGELLLLSNETATPPNLSFEREFGKMIGNLDLLSSTVADKSKRTVVRMVQSVATAVFLPVGALK